MLFNQVCEEGDEINVGFVPMTVEYYSIDLSAEFVEGDGSISGVAGMPSQLLVCLLCITCTMVVADNVNAFRVLDLVDKDSIHECLLNIEVLPFHEGTRNVVWSNYIGTPMRGCYGLH